MFFTSYNKESFSSFDGTPNILITVSFDKPISNPSGKSIVFSEISTEYNQSPATPDSSKTASGQNSGIRFPPSTHPYSMT